MKHLKLLLRTLLALVALLYCSSCYPWESVPEHSGGDNPTPVTPTDTYSQVFKPGDDGYSSYRIPAMVTCSDGSILVFAEGRVAGTSDFGDIDIVVKRSTDSGKTWSDIIIVVNDQDNRCHNPVPVVLSSGKVMLMYCWDKQSSPEDISVKTIFSNDNGQTWGASTDITPQIQKTGEYRYMVGPCHGIVKDFAPNKGRIIIPARCASPNDTPVRAFYSDDEGITWHQGSEVDYPRGNEGTVVELGNGDLIINMRTMGDGEYRYQAISHDGGATFEPATITTLIDPRPSGCQASLLRYDVDAESGKTTVLYSSPNHPSSRQQGAVKVSFDDCMTWEKYYQFVPKTGDDKYTSYTDMALLANKEIAIAYEAGFKNSNGILFRTLKFEDIKSPLQ